MTTSEDDEYEHVAWRHFDTCLHDKILHHILKSIEKLEDIEGFSNLNSEDKAHVRDFFADVRVRFEKERLKHPKRKRAKTEWWKRPAHEPSYYFREEKEVEEEEKPLKKEEGIEIMEKEEDEEWRQFKRFMTNKLVAHVISTVDNIENVEGFEDLPRYAQKKVKAYFEKAKKAVLKEQQDEQTRKTVAANIAKTKMRKGARKKSPGWTVIPGPQEKGKVGDEDDDEEEDEDYEDEFDDDDEEDELDENEEEESDEDEGEEKEEAE